jgi:rare lipoprotein A
MAVVLLAVAGACSSRHHGPTVAQRGQYKVGNPYTIDGVTYVPTEEFRHVETGVASWYGPGFHGKYTANGEVYDQTDRTAAHRTLQMPSVLRVTNLDNGQSTVVRVNDRGPFARARVLDLSRVAAEELGMVGNGTARVRLEQLETESQAMKQIALGGGGPAEQRAALDKYLAGRGPPVAVAATPPSAPPPPAPPPDTTNPAAGHGRVGSAGDRRRHVGRRPPDGGLDRQRREFARRRTLRAACRRILCPDRRVLDHGNAERQRGLITSYGSTEISPASSGGREVYRVRVGPYSTQEAAGIVADRLKRSGYGDARVVAD